MKLIYFMSSVSPKKLDDILKQDYLPIFILRNIKNSKLIGKYSDGILQFKNLAPSNELYQNMRDGLISYDMYSKKYIIELSNINLYEEINKINKLVEISGASNPILLDYDDKGFNHRTLLKPVLENMGLDVVLC